MAKNNLPLLNAIIEEYSANNFSQNENKDKIFEIFATESYFKKNDFSTEEILNGLVGGKKDWGIDGFYIIVNGKVIKNFDEIDQLSLDRNFKINIFIFQYKNSENIKESVIDKFITVAPYISNIEKSKELNSETISEDIIEKINLFHNILTKNASKFPSVKITFIHASRGDTDNIFGQNYANKGYSLKIKSLEDIIRSNNLGGNTDFAYNILGAEELKDLAQYQKSYSGDLKLNENPIFVDYGKEGQKGYIATAFLKDFFDFLVETDDTNSVILKEYLFESNIRDYQNKTEVNKDIENTLTDPAKENDFWWLNNGITILADEGSLIGKTFSLSNIQIVNGLQTSHSIYHAFKDNDIKNDQRTIFCKIIITTNNDNRDSIIKATNFQNSVPASSLRSTDIIQRDIESFLFNKGLFYDRRKNFYKNSGKPISKIISINFLAQALTAVLQQNPSKARSNPTILTKTDDDYNKLFNKHISIEVYYYIASLRLNTEQYVKNKLRFSNDSLENGINSYFHLHVLRIVSSLITKSVSVSPQDISKLSIEDIDNISSDIYDQAIDFLKSILVNEYINNGDNNLANISKNHNINILINNGLRLILN